MSTGAPQSCRIIACATKRPLRAPCAASLCAIRIIFRAELDGTSPGAQNPTENVEKGNIVPGRPDGADPQLTSGKVTEEKDENQTYFRPINQPQDEKIAVYPTTNEAQQTEHSITVIEEPENINNSEKDAIMSATEEDPVPEIPNNTEANTNNTEKDMNMSITNDVQLQIRTT